MNQSKESAQKHAPLVSLQIVSICNVRVAVQLGILLMIILIYVVHLVLLISLLIQLHVHVLLYVLILIMQTPLHRCVQQPVILSLHPTHLLIPAAGVVCKFVPNFVLQINKQENVNLLVKLDFLLILFQELVYLNVLIVLISEILQVILV